MIVYHSYLLVNFIPKPVDKHSRLIYGANLFNNNFNNFNKCLTIFIVGPPPLIKDRGVGGGGGGRGLVGPSKN